MCSRYALVPDAAAWVDFRAVFGALANELLGEPGRPQLAPTDTAPILVQLPGGAPQLVHARWGFIPQWWSKSALPRLCFNARSEEAAVKPMWRDALRRARCLIPATAWFEWQKAHGAKIPHRLATADGRGFMFAGLWSTWRARPEAEAVATCVILTRPASPGILHVHDRMPVVLAPAAWAEWLDTGRTEPAQVLALLERHAVDAVAALPVGGR